MDKPIYNLSNMPNMKTQLAFKEEKPLFMRLEQIASYSDLTREQQWQYDSSFHNYISYYGMLATKEREGKEIGFAEGEKKGRAEANIATARKMLSKGLEIDFIAEMTGLTPAEIAAL